MPKAIHHGLALSSLVFAVAVTSLPVLAQSGSAGGSIGNEEKSLSGSRGNPSTELAPSSQKSKPASGDHRASSRRSGVGRSFDGAWVVVSVGTTCSGSSKTAVVVSSGKIIGQGVDGYVSPSGSASAVSQSNGVTISSVGRLSGRSGSGTFRQSDGCSGRWSATKQ